MSGTGAARWSIVNVSLYQAAAALNANARWQEVISENLASSSIPGYKKQDLSFSAVQGGVMSQAVNDPRLRFSLSRADTATNFAPGEMKMTGVNTDVAIEGAGFFGVQLASGATGYTRDGEFQVNAQGQLATKQGYLVLGESGPIQLDKGNSSPMAISPTGEISQGEDIKGKLKIVTFDQPQLLTSINGGCFIANHPNLVPNEVQQPSLRQGYLEGSNTSSVSEMVNLITAMRTFEANQRIIQMQDQRMGQAISELGNPS